jgi:tripartite ATP-independent transporter DctM subunit
MIILSGFIMLVAGLVIGMPVVYAFGLTTIYMVIGMGYDMSFIMTTAYFRVTSFTLLCIPLFVGAGGIIEKGRMGGYLVDFIQKFVGGFKCSLAYVSSITCAVFGALTGSAAATMCCIGSILTPRMKESGYNSGFIGALFANSSMLGLLIPPSSLMIIVAWSTGLSVLSCFMSTLVPGIILCVLFCVVSAVMLRNDKNIQKPPKAASAKEWTVDLGKKTWIALPILLFPVIILGGIYGGYMTPTESAAVGAAYAILAGLCIYRSVTLREIGGALINASTTAGVILISIFMVGVISKVLTYAGLPELISAAVRSFTASRWVVLVLINIVLIILGMLMDDTSAVLLCAPLFLPLATDLGINPYHFSAIFGVNLGMAAVTPPAAPNLYTACRVCNCKLQDMLKPNLMFIFFAWMPTLILTTVFEDLALFIPRMMGLM